MKIEGVGLQFVGWLYLLALDGHTDMNASSIDQQITSLGFNAPRITPAQIDALVDQLSFHTYLIPGTTTTLASAINPAGFEVVTASANVSVAEEFSESIGRNAAITNAKTAARKELWKLESYRLKQNVFEASKVGLIAGLTVYQHEGIAADTMFVGDMAAAICATAHASETAHAVRVDLARPAADAP